MNYSQNEDYTYFKANETIQVISLDNYFLEDFHDVIDIQLNNKPLSENLFPIYLGEGEGIRAQYALSFKDQEAYGRKHNFLFFSMFLVTEAENGELGQTPFHFTVPTYS